MNAMVLAAGLGTRLRPYTLVRPKPLFPVLGIPLLHRILAQLAAANATCVVVNAHHLKEQVRDALAGRAGIVVQEEDEILGTGGGLRLAVDRFPDPGPVVVTNGDISHGFDYAVAREEHRASGAAVTMVLHDCPRFNVVDVDEAGAVRAIGSRAPARPGERRLAFTGIHVVNQDILRLIPLGKSACVIDMYRQVIASGGGVRALVRDRLDWCDIGTPEEYLALHRRLLENLPEGSHASCHRIAASGFHASGEVTLGRDVRLVGWGFVGAGAVIGDGATLIDCVVWDGAVIPAGAVVRGGIVTGVRLEED